MKILHVIATLDPHHGGPPTVASRLAAAQAGMGHGVAIVAYRAPRADERTAVALRGVPGMERVSVRQMDPPDRWERLTAGDARRGALVEAIVHDRADIVHLHGMWETLLTTAADVARRAGVPYVVAPHGMLDPWTLAQKALKKRVALSLLGRRRMLDGAKFLHALNDDEERLLAPLGLRCPVKVIPNGIFLDEVAGIPPAGTFRAKFPQLGERPYVLFLSRLHYKKGLDLLAAAFKLVAAERPDLHLVVAGPDGGERDGFLRATAANRLSDRTHVVGPLLGADKLAAFAEAVCFCLPSRQEGFSMAILEAMACGTPVVITENCHFPEVATAGAGRVVPLDASAVARGILDVAPDPAGAKEMGRRGMELVGARYTWPAIAERALALYQGT
jgi:glycosyltransferase involved in cell wall biosynthesis